MDGHNPAVASNRDILQDEVLRSFRARFTVSFAEEDLIAYRLGPRFDRIVRLPIIREAGRVAVRRLAGMVLLCVKN